LAGIAASFVEVGALELNKARGINRCFASGNIFEVFFALNCCGFKHLVPK
jgi:hypothetical protein